MGRRAGRKAELGGDGCEIDGIHMQLYPRPFPFPNSIMDNIHEESFLTLRRPQQICPTKGCSHTLLVGDPSLSSNWLMPSKFTASHISVQHKNSDP